MAIRAKMDDLRFDALVDELLDPREQSHRIADFARDVLKESQEANRAALGSVPEHRSFVDGRETDDLDAVRPDGRIVFEFRLIEGVLEWIGEQLVLMSPILTGQYVRSHVVFADGVEYEPGNVPLNAKEWVFLNVQPYSRKIDRGLSPQAPDGVFDALAAVAARRFGNIAKITYTFRAVAGDKTDRQPGILVTI